MRRVWPFRDGKRATVHRDRTSREFEIASLPVG